MTMEPTAPVYICYDTTIQESEIDGDGVIPPRDRVVAHGSPAASPQDIEQIARLLLDAEYPVIIADYMGRKPESVAYLIELAELCGAAVLDKGNRMNFPNTHSLDMTGAEKSVLPQADFILGLDVWDLYGALHPGPYERGVLDEITRPDVKVAHITLGPMLTRSWAADYLKVQETDLTVLADTKIVLPLLIEECRKQIAAMDSEKFYKQREQRYRAIKEKHDALRASWAQEARLRTIPGALTPAQLAVAIGEVVKDYDWVLVNGALRQWPRRLWNWDKADRYLGAEAGGGVGYGMGASIGAALAWRGSDRLCVNIQSDGDLLYTPSALWTAAHHNIPLLTVMYNNQSYFNSEEHARRMARQRSRPLENAGIGTHIRNPEVNFAKVAEGMGVRAAGPFDRADDLDKVIADAARYVMEERKPMLVDVIIRD